ncbi:hypothetical protein MNBD_PLANCTO02-1584 [hydrothermal vent metagenome]|uniref:Curli production assembly/transport component CsgG n=1 Tax=hydrothermal vent metagenome TaxID=652676 RepID=A0A3B1DFT8_9ZZZZ
MKKLITTALVCLFVLNTYAATTYAKDIKKTRIALFDLEVTKGVATQGVPIEAKALTDAVTTILSTVDNVTLVDRTEMLKVANEHRMNLTGLVDNGSAIKLGKFISANYVVVGRTSRIGQAYYLVLKLIDVETTVQSTVSVKSSAENGVEKLIENLQKPLSEKIAELQKPKENEEEKAFQALIKSAKPLKNKVVLLEVSEEHIERPLKDPAAQLAISHRLEKLGLKVIITKDPVDGWKKALLQTGKYGEQKVDYLLEGEGTSAFAARLHGLMSCRARVELRMIPVPGRVTLVTDRGVAAGVDLAEHLAAKKSLEEAGKQACDQIIARLLKKLSEKK